LACGSINTVVWRCREYREHTHVPVYTTRDTAMGIMVPYANKAQLNACVLSVSMSILPSLT
jgi:hypothetical protein